MSRRFTIGLAASALALAFTAGTVATASAHVGPVPRPTAVNWQFDFSGVQLDGLQLNDVRGVGAIPMTRWTETDLNPFVSKFSRGIRSVTLLHNRLPLPVLNLNTCTATFDQVGNFRIIANSGPGTNFRNVAPGIYILRGLVSVDKISKRDHDKRGGIQVCPLAFTNPFAVRAAIENGTPVAGQLPSLVDFDVQGNALLAPVTPFPHFAPTTGPTSPDNGPSA